MIARRTLQLLPLAAVLLAAAAVAAPVPKDFESSARKWERLFGTTVLPPKVAGTFQFHSKGLTAKMPATKFGNEMNPLGGLRTQALVTGDFEAQVSMRVTPPGLTNRAIFLGGGLYARDPDKKVDVGASVAQNLRGRAAHGNRPGGWIREVATLVGDADDYSDDEESIDPATTYHFRLTRTGDTFTTATSTDGKEWRALKPMKAKLPATVGVGVFCYNRTGEATDASFEEFALRPLK